MLFKNKRVIEEIWNIVREAGITVGAHKVLKEKESEIFPRRGRKPSEEERIAALVFIKKLDDDLSSKDMWNRYKKSVADGKKDEFVDWIVLLLRFVNEDTQRRMPLFQKLATMGDEDFWDMFAAAHRDHKNRLDFVNKISDWASKKIKEEEEHMRKLGYKVKGGEL